MSFSPLNINSIGQLLQNQGLQINPIAQSFMGISEFTHATYQKGLTVGGTVLDPLTDAIQVAYARNVVSSAVYDAIISIGSNSISALGDSKPVTFTNTYSKVMSQWGWLRLIPWQAWREFYINNGSYTDFCSTFSTCFGKYKQLNLPIEASNNSIEYLDKVYSNMNDLITADIAGASLSTFYWGQDLIKSGRAIDLLEIDVFGEPDALLRNLNKNKAITQAVGLSLLSVGLTDTEVKWLSTGTIKATADQQKLMYAAFCLITEADLIDVLIPLNCQTTGLVSLADLLDPKKLFPNSYSSLTVPVFNATPQPTNSKTYYLIYSTSGGVNAQIENKFGTSLIGILPTDIAQSAGAFSVSMLQIRNIQSMSIEKFSQAVMNLENVSDLNVNGTNVPTNTSLAQSALAYLALGTGVKGLYTMCDFFGAMTNIHYPHKLLTDQIISLQTRRLFNIYEELILGVAWESATVSVQYSTERVEIAPDEFEFRYRVNGISISNSGGGYGRGGGPAPIITVFNGQGASATTTISDSRYGRVSIRSVTPSSTYSLIIPTAIIESPPTELLPIQADGTKSTNGTNSTPGTSGWPQMNTPVQNYINQANDEIARIQSNNPTAATAINNTYKIFGTYLKKEQDARELALPNIEDLTSQPSDVVVFVNGSSSFGADTTTFGASNVLGQIYNPAFLGGRSLIGGLREARNQARLSLAGGTLDNDVNGTAEIPLPKVNGLSLGDYIAEQPSQGFLSAYPLPPDEEIPPGYIVDPDGDILPTGPKDGFGDPPFDNWNLTKPVTNYNVGPDIIDLPIFNGQPEVPGSFAGSPDSSLIPDNLLIIVTPSVQTILTPDQAINEVVRCNCDCWDEL